MDGAAIARSLKKDMPHKAAELEEMARGLERLDSNKRDIEASLARLNTSLP